MKIFPANKNFLRCAGMIFLTGMLLFIFQPSALAQEDPPRPISVYVYPAQGLSFGALSPGASGGSVIVYPDGSRSATGDVVLLNMGFTFSAALFGIEANPGTLISILNGSDATLTGSNGGTMTLQLGSSDPISPFVCTLPRPGRNLVRIGGTLIVGSPLASPAGSYSGSFNVTFFQE
jgi:hypothetical protein